MATMLIFYGEYEKVKDTFFPVLRVTGTGEKISVSDFQEGILTLHSNRVLSDELISKINERKEATGDELRKLFKEKFNKEPKKICLKTSSGVIGEIGEIGELTIYESFVMADD